MARSNGEGTITKLPNGTYQARITVGYDADGKQLRKAFYGKTRKEVVSKMDAAKAELNRSRSRDFGGMTVPEWLDYWLDEYKKRSVRDSTYHTMRNNLRLHVKPALADIKLTDLKPEMVQKMVNDLADQGLAKATIHKCVVYLHDSLHQAVRSGLVRKNAATNMKLPQEQDKKMRVLSVDEQERFIAVAKNYPLGEMFILMLATGLRIGEATALTWGDINFDRSCLSVNKTYTRYYDSTTGTKVYAINPPKTDAGTRSIPLLPSVSTMLRNRRPGSAKRSDLVFTNGDPRREYEFIKASGAEYWLRKILKEAGIDRGVHLHTLRHTFATRGLENGIELKVMQEFLGHANISTTADTYTHVLPDKKRDSMMKLEGSVFGMDVSKSDLK